MESGITLALYVTPQRLTKSYLATRLNSLKGPEWSIFAVKATTQNQWNFQMKRWKQCWKISSHHEYAPSTAFQRVEASSKGRLGKALWSCIDTVEVISFSIDFADTKPMILRMKSVDLFQVRVDLGRLGNRRIKGE
ncbi:hypothetical protein TSUD_262620 [Trifolium subterraneum]|nr:hypothetical protein TSUD_262620 [Trifolium subterraneum]